MATIVMTATNKPRNAKITTSAIASLSCKPGSSWIVGEAGTCGIGFSIEFGSGSNGKLELM